MKKVFIKYNPYKLETEITVDEEKPPPNSKLIEKSADGSRLQEWVEDLPGILIDEYNDYNLDILFHGTHFDYEDLAGVINDLIDKGKWKVNIEHKPANKTSDKEAQIDDVFKEIQQGPFDELCDNQIVNTFNQAKSEDFEVCVIATMKSGKSTLINAMLRQKLMPTIKEPCTAIITRIKDTNDENFKLEVYDADDKMLESSDNATYERLEMYNKCPIKYNCVNKTPECPEEGIKVGKYLDDKDIICPHWDEKIPGAHTVRLFGKIPFVSSDDVSLVLIDTPGPNNSRDLRHRKTQEQFLDESPKALVLYLMTAEYESDANYELLEHVSDIMAVGGKQSKDRFIFVVNKLDDRKKNDGKLEPFLERVRSHLKRHGVTNPNLFLAAGEPALYIRLKQKLGNKADSEISKLARRAIEDFSEKNSVIDLHFDEFASLPKSIKDRINNDLNIAVKKRNDEQKALIHTGILSIEAAIQQYVRKYAKTAKIKNIVDTFTHKLDEVGCSEETKRELVRNQNESAKIVKQIDMIREKLDNAKEAKKFENAVNEAVDKVNKDLKEDVDKIIKKSQSRITERINMLSNRMLDLDNLNYEVVCLNEFVESLELNFKTKLNKLIETKLTDTNVVLHEEYRKKLSSLNEDINTESLTDMTIDLLKLMSGSIMNNDFSSLVETKEVPNGKKWVETREWFEGFNYGYWRYSLPDFFESLMFWPKWEKQTKYKKVEYVKGDVLALEFFKPVQQSLHDNCDAAVKYAKEQLELIVKRFNDEFKKLDNVLKDKLSELTSYAIDKEKADERIKETERRLEWLDHIKARVESILEI